MFSVFSNSMLTNSLTRLFSLICDLRMSVSTGSTAQSSPSHIKWLSTKPLLCHLANPGWRYVCLSWRLYQLLHHVYCATSCNLGLCVSAFPWLLGRLLDKVLSFVLWTFHYYFCRTAVLDMLCIDNSHSLHTKSQRCCRESLCLGVSISSDYSSLWSSNSHSNLCFCIWSGDICLHSFCHQNVRLRLSWVLGALRSLGHRI